MATRKSTARKAAPARKSAHAARRPKSSAAPKKSSAAPKKSFAAPKKSFAAPKKSFAAPKKSFATPKKSFATPKKSFATPKKSFAEPQDLAVPKESLDPLARARAERADEYPAPADAVVEKAAAPAVDADPARPRAVEIARAGLDKKAEDVLVLDLRGLTTYADYFVLMTADSDRQAGAIADQVDMKLKEGGAQKVGVEGYEGGRWILIDYGDVVAHVFNREARGFYDLEGLWADAPRFTVTD